MITCILATADFFFLITNFANVLVFMCVGVMNTATPAESAECLNQARTFTFQELSPPPSSELFHVIGWFLEALKRTSDHHIYNQCVGLFNFGPMSFL